MLGDYFELLFFLLSIYLSIINNCKDLILILKLILIRLNIYVYLIVWSLFII